MANIPLNGLNKADVLAALYNASRPLGMGFMQYEQTKMTREEAQDILDGGTTYFDYLKGRVMKVDLSGDEFDPWLYDRDNGQGAAARAIRLAFTGDAASIEAVHEAGKWESAEAVLDKLHKPTTVKKYGNVAMVELGLDDVADELGAAIERAT